MPRLSMWKAEGKKDHRQALLPHAPSIQKKAGGDKPNVVDLRSYMIVGASFPPGRKPYPPACKPYGLEAGLEAAAIQTV